MFLWVSAGAEVQLEAGFSVEPSEAPFFILSSVVEYKIADMGHLKYYLAPKIEDQQDGS